MPILLYVFANLLVGFFVSFYREVFSRSSSPYSRKGRMLLALFPAVGFGYQRYERAYALDVTPNPLLRCFVWRSIRRFNWWFVGLCTVPVTIWVVGLLTGEASASYTVLGSNAQSGADVGLRMMSDMAGSVFEAIGQLILFVLLIIPVGGCLVLLFIVPPSISLRRIQRRWGIGKNSFGDPVFLP